MTSRQPSALFAAAAIAMAWTGLLLPTSAPAGEVIPDDDFEAAQRRPLGSTDSIFAVRRVETAHALAIVGRDERNPRAMITAAELLIMAGIDLPGALGDAQDELVATPAAQAAAKGSVFVPFSARALLDETSGLTKADLRLSAEIRQLQAQGDGSKLGHLPDRRAADFNGGSRVVPGHTTWHYRLEVKAGMPIRIAALGDGQAAIDLEVRDADGTLVCSDQQPDVTLACGTIPSKAGTFVVRIQNWSNAPSQVLLIANKQRHER